MYYKLPEDLRQELINYLASKPYAEVYKAMPKLSSLEKLEKSDSDNK